MNKKMSEKSKKIRVKESTHSRILKIGRMNETFNDVIVRLLDEHDQKTEVKNDD